MAKRKTAGAIQRKKDWEEYLASTEAANAFRNIKMIDFLLNTHDLEALLDRAANILGRSINKVEGLLKEIHDSRVYSDAGANSPARSALLAFEACWKQHIGQNPSHWEKRYIIRVELGIVLLPYRVAKLLECQQAARPFKLRLVRRRRVAGIKGQQVMNEVAGDSRASLVVNEATGYHVVEPDTSVIIYDLDSEGKLCIELVAIRGAGATASFSDRLFKWLLSVVEAACAECRDVRPNHGGHMSQVGLNLGPRHARVFGWAKRYTKNLDDETKLSHDLDTVGAVSLTWSLIRSVMPLEVLEQVDGRLEEYGLPRLATRHVNADHGFHMKLGETKYLFPTAERAPPEAYLSQGYEAWTHCDKAYCDWAFAFCVGRLFTAQAPQVPPKMRTRSSAKNLGPQAVTAPLHGGGSFVDASLKVVVRQATGTIIAFRPDHMHGTSMMQGAMNSIISINFSSRVAEAWEKAGELDRASVIASSGAGAGNTSDISTQDGL